MSKLGFAKEIFNRIQALHVMQDRLEDTIQAIEERREREQREHENLWALRPKDWPARPDWSGLQKAWAAETLDWENEILATRRQIESIEREIERLERARAAGTLNSEKDFELPFDQHIEGQDKCLSEK
jgi:hypothetical protein